MALAWAAPIAPTAAPVTATAAATPTTVPTAPTVAAAVPSRLAPGAGLSGTVRRAVSPARGPSAAASAVAAEPGVAADCCNTWATVCSPAPTAGREPRRTIWRAPSRAISSGLRGIKPSSSVASANSSRESVSPPSHGLSWPWLLSASARRVLRSASGPLMRGVVSALTSAAAKVEAANSAGSVGAGSGSGATAGTFFTPPSACPNKAIRPGGNRCSARPSCGSLSRPGCCQAASTTSSRGVSAGPSSASTSSATGTAPPRSCATRSAGRADASSARSRGSSRLWPSIWVPNAAA